MSKRERLHNSLEQLRSSIARLGRLDTDESYEGTVSYALELVMELLSEILEEIEVGE